MLDPDVATLETAVALRDAFVDLTGLAPHLVVSHLRRSKLDPNREIEEAAQGSPFAENAWLEFHGFIEVAREAVDADHGAGLYIDLHGHGHPAPRLELGYLLSAADLALSDAGLDVPSVRDRTSLRALGLVAGLRFSQLIRGPTSLGGLLALEGVRAVPSPSEPTPGTDPFFSGGYDTVRHGSRDGGTVSGIQIELHRIGIRDTDEDRRAFAARLAAAARAFMLAHYGSFGPAAG